MSNIPTDCMTWRKYAPQIAKLLDVKMEQILLIENGYSIIDPYKIANILIARGQFSWETKESIKDCLDKHYAGVSELYEAYWRYDVKMRKERKLKWQ